MRQSTPGRRPPSIGGGGSASSFPSMSPSVASSTTAAAEPRFVNTEGVKPEIANGGSVFSRDSVESLEPPSAAETAPAPGVVESRGSDSGRITTDSVLDVVGEGASAEGRESLEMGAALAPGSVETTHETANVGGLPSSETESGNGNGVGVMEVDQAGEAVGAADDVAAAIARATADFARLPPRVFGSDKEADDGKQVGGENISGSDTLAGIGKQTGNGKKTDGETKAGSVKQAGMDKQAGGDKQAGNGKPAGSVKQGGNEKQTGSDKQAGETGEKKGLATRARSVGGGASSSLMRGTASSSSRLKLTAPATLEENGRGDISAPRTTGRRASESIFPLMPCNAAD